MIAKREVNFRSRYTLFAHLYGQHLTEQPLETVYPPPGEIAALACVRRIVEEAPTDQVFSSDTFRPVFTHLPSLVKQWHIARTQEILALLQNHRPNASVSDLSLATIVFRCSNIWHPMRSCGEIHTSSTLLRHGCLSKPPPRAYLDARDAFWFLSTAQWNKRDRVAFDRASSHCAKRLLECLGLDPMTTTSEQIDRLRPIFRCETCSTHDQNMPGSLTWRQVVCIPCFYGEKDMILTFFICHPPSCAATTTIL